MQYMITTFLFTSQQFGNKRTSSVRMELPTELRSYKSFSNALVVLCKQLIEITFMETARIPPAKPPKRLLMRQPRIKKESDLTHTSPDSEPGSPQFSSSSGGSNQLTLPAVRMERHLSEPPPCTSPPVANLTTSTGNLLTVPQPAFLVKQHSHPLLPSQQSVGLQSAPPTLLVQRQQSQPAPGQSCLVSHPPPPLQVHLVAAPVQPPTSQESSGRAISPSVVIEQLPVLRVVTDQTPSDACKSSQTTGLRVRSDELRRASSSPQASSPREGLELLRSGHCPVLRPGPALGCNFCWNTIDGHGRILRRKTKYHCPECQTNLCIVPCFQEYHERQAGSSREAAGSISPTMMKMLPKTSSI